MGGATTEDRTGRGTAIAMALTGRLAAQDVIELPAEDRSLDADFEETYRVGPLDRGWLGHLRPRWQGRL